MAKRYNSAINAWLAGYVMLILGGTTVLFVIKIVWIGLLINIPLIAWLLHMGYNTYYIIENGTLYITCGLFYKEQFLVADIIQVRATNNPLSSPALSMERLEIQCKDKKTVMISPRQKTDFIQELIRLNPQIKVSV